MEEKDFGAMNSGRNVLQEHSTSLWRSRRCKMTMLPAPLQIFDGEAAALHRRSSVSRDAAFLDRTLYNSRETGILKSVNDTFSVPCNSKLTEQKLFIPKKQVEHSRKALNNASSVIRTKKLITRFTVCLSKCSQSQSYRGFSLRYDGRISYARLIRLDGLLLSTLDFLDSGISCNRVCVSVN
ncbi:hypothetical protein T4B_12076 [Trichinella pseudospiralis]|uniref:Uncharacterized protein n=1 Tax=Trichinella pseudospiralis TaxID=6337 RepID=A0A0V1J6D5_TRIPS|nr:hypothetical protein T4B_12076 [Trichinella pseudospiralis]KRZ42767.1 hypothetical protein T4C_3762 [Trichinella pseudospiralis]